MVGWWHHGWSPYHVTPSLNKRQTFVFAPTASVSNQDDLLMGVI